jgi:hypothetical protein
MIPLEIRAQQWHEYWTVWNQPQREAARINVEILAAELERERKLDQAKALRDRAQREKDAERMRTLRTVLRMTRGA